MEKGGNSGSFIISNVKGEKMIWDHLPHMYLGGRVMGRIQGNLPVSRPKLVTSLNNIAVFPEKQPAGGFLSFKERHIAVLL